LVVKKTKQKKNKKLLFFLEKYAKKSMIF